MESWEKKETKQKCTRRDKTRKQEGAGAVNQLEPVSCVAPKITEIIIIMTKNKSSDCGQWLPKKSNCEYTHVNVNVDYQFACASKFALTTFLFRRVLSLHVSVCGFVCISVCVCACFQGLAPGQRGPSILSRPSNNVSRPGQLAFVGFLASLGVNSIKVICCRHF